MRVSIVTVGTFSFTISILIQDSCAVLVDDAASGQKKDSGFHLNLDSKVELVIAVFVEIDLVTFKFVIVAF